MNFTLDPWMLSNFSNTVITTVPALFPWSFSSTVNNNELPGRPLLWQKMGTDSQDSYYPYRVCCGNCPRRSV